MLDLLKRPVVAVQDFFLLFGPALRNVFRGPHYTDDIVLQMDDIGVGSLPIVVLTGLFSGAVMALQMYRALATYGQVGQTGKIVAISLVRAATAEYMVLKQPNSAPTAKRMPTP